LTEEFVRELMSCGAKRDDLSEVLLRITIDCGHPKLKG
jgi:hypothetical protein